ncbi:hypothetical protein [Tenacibaculum discolor]|uniref:hypothetical protein n=1 Tax=Tenacibaculum discolor TaxID=361581 RepID=UPI000EAD951F|nr:hypothetical protein [Tenacibaculum discolor]RLK00434.1 hypothetical protein C8N27_2121 [Tenacibaculum discolor]
MKKGLFILLFFYSFLGFGQELYEKIKVKIIEYGIHDDDVLNIVQFNQYIDFTKPMTMTYTGAAAGTSSIETTDTTWYLKDNDEDGFPDGIGFEQIQTYTDDINSGGGSPEFIDFKMTDFKEFNKDLFCNGYLTFHLVKGDAEAYYKLLFEPLITINQSSVQNDIACNDVVINTNEVSQGFSNNSYIWQYHLGDSNWINFPNSYQGNSSLTVNSSFFNNYLGNVFIQVSSCSLVSNTVTYNVISCSPQLQKPVVTQKTSCNYKADGSLTLDFKRDLHTTEKLAVIIYQQNTESGEYDVILDQKLDIESLEKINETTYRYRWVNNLPHGTYKLKYQTGKKGVGINPEDISWSNLVPVEFIIEETAKVDFQVTGSADQNCFMENDGYIDISATGESSRTFLYQLKKDDVIQVFNGTNWVNYTGNNVDNETWFPFTNAKTTRISNLNKGAYNVKVKDSEECLAKQL